mgnify:CR=1 FL=1
MDNPKICCEKGSKMSKPSNATVNRPSLGTSASMVSQVGSVLNSMANVLSSNKLCLGSDESLRGLDNVTVFICEKWESKNPIEIENGLFISLEKDLIDLNSIKKKILSAIMDSHPDLYIKMGSNEDNLVIKKRSFPIEIQLS